jgi:hypothetical protein
MTFEQAIAAQPLWVQYWLYWLVFGTFILPLTLLIWKQTRLTAVLSLVASLMAGFGVSWLYGRMGYVKLLGLPHILFWTPLVIYLFNQYRKADLPRLPKSIILLVAATIIVSLTFDYVDVARYILGERNTFAGTQ